MMTALQMQHYTGHNKDTEEASNFVMLPDHHFERESPPNMSTKQNAF